MRDYQCPHDCQCDRPWESCECRCHELDDLLQAEEEIDILLARHDGKTYSHEVVTHIITAKSILATAIRAHDATIRIDSE
jgi:hypothetical protein